MSKNMVGLWVANKFVSDGLNKKKCDRFSDGRRLTGSIGMCVFLLKETTTELSAAEDHESHELNFPSTD
jgi:hypothetical protein